MSRDSVSPSFMVPLEYTGGAKVGGYGRDRPVFWLSSGKDKPKDHQHVAFTARSRAEVDAFHAAGDLPTSFEGVRQEAFSKQDEEDAERSGVDVVFDIPASRRAPDRIRS